MTETARAADLFARRLAEPGCRRAFGLLGGRSADPRRRARQFGDRAGARPARNCRRLDGRGCSSLDRGTGILLATLGPGTIGVAGAPVADRFTMIAAEIERGSYDGRI